MTTQTGDTVQHARRLGFSQ